MIFYYAGGALVCDEPITGVTQDTGEDCHWYDGHRYFIAESMSKAAARRIVHGLGGVLFEANVPPARQLVGATVDIDREVTRHAFYGEHPRKAAV